jgi:hypothetical protein
MEKQQPDSNSLTYHRYQRVEDYGRFRTYPLPLGPEGLEIPANSGCRVFIPGENLYPLRGVFTVRTEPEPKVELLGSQRATFQSYIGVGGVGIFQPLMRQLRTRYQDRAGRVNMDIPPGADYVWIQVPPMPGDAFSDLSSNQPIYNAARKSGGTYRLSGEARDLSRDALSGDLVFAAAFPLKVAWRDADLSGNRPYLPEIEEPRSVATPEYVLPPGIEYDPCFTTGDCSGEILEAIHQAESEILILYLSIDGSWAAGEWRPLEMAGVSWPTVTHTSGHYGSGFLVMPRPKTSAEITGTWSVFLPLTLGHTATSPTENCPCGWFDQWGRMLDYEP